MVVRRLARAVLVAVVVLLSARTALANGMSPIAGFWPGFFLLSPLFGIPATLLAAFIERPLLTAAGVRRYALVQSIRANLLSWLVGAVIVFVLFTTDSYAAMDIYILCSVPLSIWIEGTYLRRAATRRGDTADWGMIIVANIASGAALFMIGTIALNMGENDPLVGWRLKPYEIPLSLAGGALSLAIVVYGLWPRRLEKPLPEPASAAPSSPVEKVERDAEMPAVV
jgi:hypothetical protein